LIHLWNGINRWVPGKLALDNYLGMWLRYRMMNYTGRVIEDSAMESVYGEYEPDSDEVLWVVSRDDRPEVAIDFRKGILRIVSRDACKARCVRELMQGQTVRQAVYAACGKAPHPERERFQNELITELTEMVKE
jgi:hypothetical protein